MVEACDERKVANSPLPWSVVFWKYQNKRRLARRTESGCATKPANFSIVPVSGRSALELRWIGRIDPSRPLGFVRPDVMRRGPRKAIASPSLANSGDLSRTPGHTRMPTPTDSAVIVTAHAMQELMSEAQRSLVVDFAGSFVVGQVDLASQRAGLTAPLQDREAVAVILADLTQIGTTYLGGSRARWSRRKSPRRACR